MPEEKSLEKKEGEVERQHLSESQIEKRREKEKSSLSEDERPEKRKEALKKEIEQSIKAEEEQEIEEHKQAIEEKMGNLEEHFKKLAYEDVGKALKALKKLPSHKRDTAVDTLCRDEVFWDLVKTGKVDYDLGR